MNLQRDMVPPDQRAVLVPSKVRGLAIEAEQTLVEAEVLTIENAAGYSSAAAWLQKIKAKAKALEDARREMTRPLDESKARIIDWFRGPLGLLGDAEAKIKSAMLAYTEAERRAAEKEQRRLAEEAAASAERERAAILAEAAAHRQAGLDETAEDLEEEAEEVEPAPVVRVVPNLPRVSGIATRTVWKVRILDPDAIPREYMIPDEKQLLAIAKATKGAKRIPGVEFYSEAVLAARNGRF